MMRFQLDDLHAVALNAFDEMEGLAVKAESDTTEFNERQFVFQLGALLTRGAITQGAHLWTGFEYRYPGTADARDRTTCDLVVWERNRQSDGTIGWLEVKSTGLDENGNWDNRFGGLRWREDFDKLKGITERVWNLHHIRAWVWLYQFENYREQVDEAFRTGTKWSPPKDPLDYLNTFGPVHAGKVNLPRVVSEIASASGSALMSVRPRVRAHDKNKVFSALILTAMVATASHPVRGDGK
jgi:hypothetical protein